MGKARLQNISKFKMNFLSSHFIIFDFLSSFVNWGDSKECVHSVANRRSFDDDSLSSAYGKKIDFQNFTRIALLQNFGPMTELKLNMAKTEMKTLQTFWELLNSPFQSTQPASKSSPGLSKPLSSQELT